MRSLPLYLDRRLAVEQATPRSLNPACDLCPQSRAGKSNTCLPAVGKAGGVLIVGDRPGAIEEALNEPYAGRVGDYLKAAVQRSYDGPVAYDNALRCRPSTQVRAGHVEACRDYLLQTIRDVQPQRIILLGDLPVLSFFDESVPSFDLRRAHGWLYNDGQPIPVLIVMNPEKAMTNRFVRRFFEADLKWALTCDTSKLFRPPWDALVELPESVEEAQRIVDICYDAGGITYDIETCGRRHDAFFHVTSCAVTPYGADRAFVWSREALQDPALRQPLLDMLADTELPTSGQYVKYDHCGIKAAFGAEVRGTDMDTSIVRKLLWSDSVADLESLSFLVGMGGHKREAKDAVARQVAGIQRARRKAQKAADTLPGIMDPIVAEAMRSKLPPKTFAYGLIDSALLYRYNALDAISSDRLRRWQKPQLEQVAPVNRIHNLVVRDAIEAIAQIEYWGMPASRAAIDSAETYLGERLLSIEKRFAAYNLNPSAPAQVADLLYNKLKLPAARLTDKGQPSTDKFALKAIADKHPIVRDLLDYRKVEKLKSTYFSGFRAHIREDGRIHPTIRIDGTESGRASCTSPNLMNLPRASRDELARLSRSAFQAGEGRVIVELDFSQIELRIAAMLSGDKRMIELFRSGRDFHRATAELIAPRMWKKRPEDVTDEDRSAAKTCNFAVMYLAGPATLAAQLGCSENEAARLQHEIMGEFKTLAAYIEASIQEAYDTGWSWTSWLGEPARRRSLWRIGALGDDQESRRDRSHAKRAAWNHRPQGSAAEYCTSALIDTVRWIKTSGADAKLIVSVYDSLLFDVAEDQAEGLIKQARGIMLSRPAGDVPLEVDAKIGPSWGDLHAVKHAA